MNVVMAAGPSPDEVRSARALADALRTHGIRVSVLHGSLGTGTARIERADGVARLVRTDPAAAHWLRARSADASALVRRFLAEESADVLHVLSWNLLPPDLVAAASAAGVPATVSLADASLACLVRDRRRRDVPAPGAWCGAPLGPVPCLACADADARHGPTPWVPLEARFLAAAERARDAEHELTVARVVLVADDAAVTVALRTTGARRDDVPFRAVGDALDPDAVAAAVVDAAREARPEPVAAAWWTERMQREAETAFDAAYLQARGGA